MGTKTTMNIGLSLSKNFNKVTLDITDETFEHETNAELSEQIREKFALIRREIAYQFENLK